MHTVYIDVLITVNVLIDFILLLCTKQALSVRAGLTRMILGALAGGVTSLAALLPELFPPLNMLMDIAFAALIILIAFGKTRLKSFCIRTAVYFAFSFSLSGLTLFFCTSLHIKGMSVYNDVVYFDIPPVLLIILTLVCYYILRLLKRLTKGVCGKSTCNIDISLNGHTASFLAAVDTGCSVKEPFSGKYVIIAEQEILHDLRFEDATMRIIPFDSLGGSGMLTGYPADSLRIDGVLSGEKVYIGVCEGVLKGEVKALVPAILTNER